MLLSVRHLRACSLIRPSSVSPVTNLAKRSFLTDGANVIGSKPDKNSPDFQVSIICLIVNCYRKGDFMCLASRNALAEHVMVLPATIM